MNIVLKTGIIFTGYLLLCINYTTAQKQQQNYYTPTQSDTWVATDALGRTVGENIINFRRAHKTVGLFYFIWQGAHGYDHHSGSLPDEGVMTATATDSISPYDISEMLRRNPENPAYGPVHAFHYWGQPYLGYYLPDDEWGNPKTCTDDFGCWSGRDYFRRNQCCHLSATSEKNMQSILTDACTRQCHTSNSIYHQLQPKNDFTTTIHGVLQQRNVQRTMVSVER